MFYILSTEKPTANCRKESALTKQRDASGRPRVYTRRKIYDVLTSQLQPPYIAADDSILS